MLINDFNIIIRLRYAGDVSYFESYLENKPIFDKTVKEALKPIHCDDELYLFDILKVESKKDMEMRKIMISYWTNFAKYGNPSPFESDNLTQWIQYSTEKVVHMLFYTTFIL